MKTLTHISTLILTGMVLWLSPVLVSASDPAPEQAHALARVTQIRQNPLAYAQTLGYDRDELVSRLPWLSGALYHPVLPTLSPVLTQRAEVRNIPDSNTSEPAIQVNTDFAFAGDISGVVSFINYQSPQAAMDIVINNQVKNELDPAFQGKRVILSPDFPLMGASFTAGKIQVEAQERNAYYIHICFASEVTRSAVQVVNLINQVRANPSSAYQYLSFMPDFLSTGPGGPLFLDAALGSTAAIHLSTPIDVFAHARYFGFMGSQTADISAIETFPHVSDSNQIALWMFSSLLVAESRKNPAGDVCFNPSFNAVGPALYHARGQVQDWVKTTLVTGRTADQHPDVSRVFGVVFVDRDGNGIYTPGEEVPDRLMAVQDMSTRTTAATAVTNRAGQFALNLPANAEYRIQTQGENNLNGKLIFLGMDQYVEIKVKNP
jgi:hypothetical protein